MAIGDWNKGAVQIAKYCPLNRLVLETDAPYLADEPRDILGIATRVAELKGISIALVLDATSKVCARFYRIGLESGSLLRDDKQGSWHDAVDWNRESRIRQK